MEKEELISFGVLAAAIGGIIFWNEDSTNPYLASKKIEDWIETHADYVIEIAPLDYLRLTTKDEAHLKTILDEAPPMQVYLDAIKKGRLEKPPRLTLWQHSGVVVDHDGRHRAAAAVKTGIGLIRVAICFMGESGIDPHMPACLIGQFSRDVVECDQFKIVWRAHDAG